MNYIKISLSLLLLVFIYSGCVEANEETQHEPITQTQEVITSLEQYLDSIDPIDEVVMDEKMALGLVALPLACVDHPHSKPTWREYLYNLDYRFISDYEDTRSFYGCYDWHSAVHSHWTMVKTLKKFPNISVGPLIIEKLNNHLSEESLKGELEFFELESNKSFERPYGYAWAMKLYEELYTWDDEKAQEWAENLKPLVDLFRERTITYIENRTFPMRNGTHSNTAFNLRLMLDYARNLGDTEFEQAIENRSRFFFENDRNCPTTFEPSGSDFISPCLAQANLMGELMGTNEFAAWLDVFMPPLYSEEFQYLANPIEFEDKDAAIEELAGSVTHLDGLLLHRAWSMNEIAVNLPEDDLQREILNRLSSQIGQEGMKVIFDTDYVGTHWLGTYAFYFMLTTEL